MINRNKPASASRGENPFPFISKPLPLYEENLRAVDLFTNGLASERISINAGWLQARPRTSEQIDEALFPYYSLGGMEHEEVRFLLNRAIWDAGYEPSNKGQNPTWTWTEGK